MYYPLMIIVKKSLSRVFEPEKWNDPMIRRRFNCLAYALDDQEIGNRFCPDFRRPDIVDRGGIDLPNVIEKWKTSISKKADNGKFKHHLNVNDALYDQWYLAYSGLEQISAEQAQSMGAEEHVIAYSRLKEHIYRKDSDGTWSHKPGAQVARNIDDQRGRINCLEEALWKNYDENGNEIFSPHKSLYGQENAPLQYFRVPESGLVLV